MVIRVYDTLQHLYENDIDNSFITVSINYIQETSIIIHMLILIIITLLPLQVMARLDKLQNASHSNI